MDLIDKMFPIKDEDGNPLYRKHQKETIQAVLKDFEDEKNIVGVEGPTGCGKSVINYTVGRCVGKKTVYITPTKALQDQIGKETWDEIRILKGKRSYLCNHVMQSTWPSVGFPVYCYDDSGEYITCENHLPVDVHKRDDLTPEDFSGMMKIIWGYETMRFRSSFKSEKHFFKDLKENIVPAIVNKYKQERSLPDDEKTISFSVEPINDTEIWEFSRSYVLDNITCKLSDIECYHRSSRLLISLFGMKIVNPEVMYYYNQYRKTKSPFYKCDLLVIDECHNYDAVMQRIFKVILPVELIRTDYGIDFSRTYNKQKFDVLNAKTKFCDDNLKETLEGFNDISINILKPIMMGLSYIRAMLTTLMVHNTTSRALITSSNKIHANFMECFKDIYDMEGSIRFFDILRGVYGDKYESQLNEFNKFMEGEGFVFNRSALSIIDYVENRIGSDIDKMCSDATLEWCKVRKVGIMYGCYVSKDYVIAKDLMNLNSVLSDFFSFYDRFRVESKIFALIWSKMSPSSIIKECGYKIKGEKEPTDCISLTIIKTGQVIRDVFCKHAKHTLFSSGTWCFPGIQKEKLGVEDLDLIKVPSTFKAMYRPVYYLKGLLNFSKKIPNPDGSIPQIVYHWKTYPHIYVNALESIIVRINQMFRSNKVFGYYCPTPNILIHSFTHEITKSIAANISDDTNYWIDIRERVWNKKLDKFIQPYPKDIILSDIDKNLNKGIIIVSPSMNEGIDFKQDKARVQILLKHPIPNSFEDAYVHIKTYGSEFFGVKANPKFITHLIFSTLCQQYGRIVRSEEDWGFTFIFDEAAEKDLNKYVGQDYKIENEANCRFLYDGLKTKKHQNGVVDYLQFIEIGDLPRDIPKSDEWICSTE